MSKRTKKMLHGANDRRRSYGRCDSIFFLYKVDTVEVRTSHYTDRRSKECNSSGTDGFQFGPCTTALQHYKYRDIAYIDAFKVTQLNRNTICISKKKPGDRMHPISWQLHLFWQKWHFLWRVLCDRDETVPYFDGIQVNSIVMDEKLDIKKEILYWIQL